jgi:hypothetical protein
MLDEGKPDLVVAFPGGGGTANMCKQAREAGVRGAGGIENPPAGTDGYPLFGGINGEPGF